MEKRANYNTRQAAEILDYLRAAQGRHVTAGEICEHFKAHGIAVGTTTVYRSLERMVEQGAVVKYVVDGTSGACFEYIGGQQACEKPVCFHCKCRSCGRVIHLHCDEAESLGRHLREEHEFEMDSARTVFLGVCGECRVKGEEASEG
ncbi:MAG: transcriptional repressor [Clostridia bacterium]|nr:transcriptional repressor [Clostridia bacterium]